MSALPTSGPGEDLYPTLLELSGHDPYVRWHVAPERLLDVRSRDGATLWTSRRHAAEGPLWLQAFGAPAAAAALAVDVVAELAATDVAARGATLPRGSYDLLPESLRADSDDWDWWYITEQPATQPGEERVRWLDDVDPADVAGFLDRHSPRHSASPGDPHVRRWAGALDDDGRLLATSAHEELDSGAPHLASVATRTDARGQGWGGAVTAWITRQLLPVAGVVTLGMYADNEPARRVYRRLGYTDPHRWTSIRWP